jgi:hypothetical protein
MITATAFNTVDGHRTLETLGKNPYLVKSIAWDMRSQKYVVEYSTADETTRLIHKTAYVSTEDLTRAKVVKTIEFAKGLHGTQENQVGVYQDACVNLISLNCTCREHTDITHSSGVSFCRHSIHSAKTFLGLSNIAEIVGYVTEQGYAKQSA